MDCQILMTEEETMSAALHEMNYFSLNFLFDWT